MTIIFTVNQQTEAIITRFGKYVRTEKDPGLHFQLLEPFNKVAKIVPMTLQQQNDKLTIKTSDDLFVGLPISVQWEVADSKKFAFDSSKPLDQVITLIEQSVRAHISGKSFQDLYSGDRNAISDAVIADVQDHVSEYGVRVRRVVVDQPEASSEVRAKYEQVRTSAMGALAAANDGKTTIIQETSKAEGEKQRDWLRGDGAAGYLDRLTTQRAKQIKTLVDAGMTTQEANQSMLEFVRLDTYREIASQGNMVIVVPDTDTGRNVANIQAAVQAANFKQAPKP